MPQLNNCDREQTETIGPFEICNNQQTFVHTFFGMIIFDENIHNFVPAIEVLRQYTDQNALLMNLMFSSPSKEIVPLAKVLSSLMFDEIFDDLIFELPMRIYSLFPKEFNFKNEGKWFELMDQLKNIEHVNVNTLKLCGDVELNPGPVQSRPVYTQNNDPRVIQLEKVIVNRDRKIKTLIRKIEQITKRPLAQMTNPHAQGILSDLKTFAAKAAELPDSNELRGVTGNIDRITNFLDQMLPVLQANFSQTGLVMSDKLVSVKDDMIKIIILVLLVKLFMKFKSYRSAVALVLLFVCQHYGLHNQIIELVRDLIKQVTRPQAEIESEEIIYSPAFQTCGKIIFAVLAFICVKKIPGKQDWDTYLMRLDRLPKAHAGAQKIYDFTTEYWNLAHESIKMMVLGKTREELRAASGIYTEIEKWASDVRKYLDLEERNKIDVDVNVAAEVESLWKRGLEFKADKLLSREADKLVTTMLMPARSLYEYVSTSPIKGGGPRMKPVCVWLCGASGIGKTEMVYPLCIDVLREMGLMTKDDYQHQVYARQVETEYWDGYKGQKIVIYDDAFQKKDDRVTGNPELFEVIRSCNTFPQHLHMAALQEKNTFSSAELMLYTTNEMNVEINSLTFPDAFKNRMYENAYVVTPKEQYRVYTEVSGKEPIVGLDLTKIDSEQAIDLSIYQFQKMNKNLEQVGAPIDYDEFAKMVATQWRSKKQESLNKLKFLENYALRPKSQMDNDIFEDSIFDFSSDISARMCAGENLESIEYSYSLNNTKFNQFREWKKNVIKPNIWQKYIDRFNIVFEEFKVKLLSLQEEAARIISEHPYISLMGFVGVALAMFGLYQIFSKEEEIKPSAEITASGDVRTIRQMRPKVEITASGDVRTNKLTKPRVEITASGDVKTQNQVRIRIEGEDSTENDAQYLADFINDRKPSAQGCSDPPALLLVTDILYKNTYKMVCTRGSTRFYIGNVTFIKGWVASMPYHFIEGLHLRDLYDTTVCLTQDGVTDLIQFPASYLLIKRGNTFDLSKNIVRLEHISGGNQDCVVFCLHRQMCQPHRNIMPHVVTQSDLKELTGSMRGTMSTFHKRDGVLYRNYHTFRNINSVDNTIEIDLDVERQISYTQRSYYTYDVTTAEGDCGSLIGIFSKRMTRKLIGMHIAGDTEGTAYACPWTFERLTIAIAKLEKIHGPVAQMEYALDGMTNSFEHPNMPVGGFVPVGKSKIRLGQATKTTLLKSRIYGMLRPATMAPAILRTTMINKEMINPMLNGLKKCGMVPTLLNADDLNACTNDIAQLLRTNFCDRDVEVYRRVLTYEEAVMGANDEFMTAVNRLTSPGIPYSQNRDGKPGKTKWLGCNENFDFVSDSALSMKHDVNALISDCRNGVIRGVYCSDTLKDERRIFAKVHKPRVFSACPVHFVLAFRQYFLGFAAWCMHNRIDNEVAVGTNQYSLDWNKIALRLQNKGHAVIAGDFSNFDGSLNAQILWSILDIVNDWYDDGIENQKVRLGLWAHIVHSTHIFEDNVYMWTHSQPSGNPFTVIINSIYNSIVMRMSWQIVMKPHGKSGMDQFRKHVSMISYGDDNALNISREVIGVYNQQTIADALAIIAHTYTDEGKTGEIVKSRTLSDINFLKRGFIFSQELQRYIAPLEEQVIYEMINWTRNTIDPDEILKTNVQTAAREMALHGRCKFDNFCKEMRQIESNFRILPHILTYPEYLLDMEVNSDSYFN
nr:MAG: hypothetical protein 1 [Dicistroviridae sp.]